MNPIEEHKQEWKIWYDDNKRQDVMYIAVPIQLVAENDNGTMFLRGFFEEAKAEALLAVKMKRMAKAQNGVIMPGVPPPPADLKVH